MGPEFPPSDENQEAADVFFSEEDFGLGIANGAPDDDDDEEGSVLEIEVPSVKDDTTTDKDLPTQILNLMSQGDITLDEDDADKQIEVVTVLMIGHATRRLFNQVEMQMKDMGGMQSIADSLGYSNSIEFREDICRDASDVAFVGLQQECQASGSISLQTISEAVQDAVKKIVSGYFRKVPSVPTKPRWYFSVNRLI